MTNSTQIPNEYISKIVFDLKELKNILNDKVAIEKLENIVEFINENVMNPDKDMQTFAKKMIYNRMTKVKNSSKEESLELYKLYQLLKMDLVDYEEAIERYGEIVKRYNNNE